MSFTQYITRYDQIGQTAGGEITLNKT